MQRPRANPPWQGLIHVKPQSRLEAHLEKKPVGKGAGLLLLLRSFLRLRLWRWADAAGPVPAEP